MSSKVKVADMPSRVGPFWHPGDVEVACETLAQVAGLWNVYSEYDHEESRKVYWAVLVK